MIHQDNDPSIPPASLRQVEFNTIASSFGGLAAKVSEMHYHLRTHEAYPDNVNRILSPEALPANPSIQGLAKGLVAAHRAYGSSLTEQTQQCILVTVQDPERNTFDQKHIEYEVQRQGARIFRLPFDRVLEDTFLVPEKEQALVYTPPAFPYRAYEVTTIYYRAGYAPSEYEKHYIPSKPEIETQAWQARLQLERSRAIKCPSVLTHLAGCKKVQQILATPGSNHLSRFLRSGDLVDTIRETFMPILPLDESPAGQAGRKLALDPQACQRYVLKPQREGGGNNIYRSKIPDFLRSQDETAWSQYILMEMIETPAQRNVILRNGETMEGGVICELGCYGAVIWNAEGQTLFNEELGTLMRTKGDQSEEGGVAAGFGAVDSPVLINV